MAIIPAFLFYFSAFLYVYLKGEKLKLIPLKQKVDIKELFWAAPVFLGPLGVIVMLLVLGYSIQLTAFFAVVSAILFPLIRIKELPSFSIYIQGFVEGAKNGARVGSMLAGAGIISATFSMTGLGIKITHGIETLSHGNLFLALLIIWGITVIMGMAGLGLIGYILVAIFGAPALMKMGVPLSIAHFFILYIAVFGAITPPVAIGALIASKLANSDYIRTAIEATKVGMGGFLIPFMFVYAPILVLGQQKLLPSIMSIFSSLLCLLALESAFVGYLLMDCNLFQRLLLSASGILLIFSMGFQNYIFFIVGVALLTLMILSQWKAKLSINPYNYKC